MDRKALRDRVRFLTLIEPHEVSNLDIDGLLTEAYNHVVTAGEWPWNYTTRSVPTVAGQVNYEIDEGAGVPDTTTIVNVALEDTGQELRSISVELEKRYNTEQTIEGTPVYFSVRRVYNKTRLALFPIPDRVWILRVTYRGFFAFGTSEASSPPFHDAFHEMLADYAIYRVWEREEDLDKAGQYRGRFDLRLSDMHKFYNHQAEDRPRIFGERQRPYAHRW